ncbi:MAG TPA: FAD/NAD(P)-binding protein [Candidatus Acidoferrales bacterium]|nr:FAD/NAD(P)-binding protein [Candidatus Acidoferrales bacterium]
MESAFCYDAIVVGGGLAGTTVIAELAAGAPRNFTALLVDGGEPGPGSAYATPSEHLYMNGSALAMSAVPGDERHLVRWLRNQPDHAKIPRRLFGRYLRERFYAAVARRPRFHVARAEIVDLLPAPGGGFEAIDDGGNRYRARAVVLALGNYPPDDAFLPEALRHYEGFVGDPWRFDPQGVREDVLVIGSGLTAMDAVALLERTAVRRVHVISRHGLVPATDGHCVEAPPEAPGLRTETPYALLRTLRRAARRHQAAGGDWRDVIEAIREMSASIWASWDLRERRRFLRHVQPYWSIHRYRVPEKTAEAFARMERSGRLVRYRGRAVAARKREDGRLDVDVRGNGATQSIAVETVVNCTGPNGDYARVRHPLVRNAIARGLLRPDPLRLGLDATPEFRVVDGYGRPHETLFALGPPLRGLFYETTAVPETRDQAAAIARALIARDAGAGLEAVS